MSHKTFMTTRDHIETAVRPPRPLVPAIWAAATGVAVLGMIAATGVGALAFGLAAAYSGFKTYDGAVSFVKGSPKPIDSHSTKTDLRELDATTNVQGLANNNDPVPQLGDDVSRQEWQKQLSDRARSDARNHVPGR